MQTNAPLVSIGIPCYNSARFLREALDSLLAQSHQHIEIILYNDGSTDESLKVVQSFDEPRLILIDNKHNSGVATARQAIKNLAQGEFLTWLDADDHFHPQRIEILLGEALDSGADLVIDNASVIDEDGTPLKGERRIPDLFLSDPHFTRIFERNFMLPHPLIRRRCFSSIDYDPVLTTSEDYDYWLQCSLSGFTFHRLDKTLLNYRITNCSLSSNPAQSREAVAYIFSKYKISELQELYRTRGYSTEIVNYMTCLQNIFRGRFREALASTSCPWPAENEADKDFYIGTLSLTCGKLDMAEIHLLRHLQQVERSPAGLNNLGVLLHRQGKDGQPHWLKALDLFPHYLDARNNLNGTEALTLTQLPPQRHR